jgi:hypothetical protein
VLVGIQAAEGIISGGIIPDIDVYVHAAYAITRAGTQFSWW